MNKKILTLLAAGFMGSLSVSAFAEDFNPSNERLAKLHQLVVGDQVLSVRKNYNKTLDSLYLTTSPSDVTTDAYKKTLWSISKSNVDNNESNVFTFTNYATGKVLSLDLTTGSGNITSGQSAWLVQDDKIKAIKNGKTYFIGLLSKENADGETEQHVAVMKDGSDDFAASFYVPTEAGHTEVALSVKQINGLYGTANVLQFLNSMQGNPINGNPFQAIAIRTSDSQTAEDLQNATEFNVRFTDGKYLVVDTLQWSNNVASGEYWKVTTDAKPSTTKTNIDGDDVLANGRPEDTYTFKMTLNVESGYKISIFPIVVPKQLTTDGTELKSKFCYGTEITDIALSYAQFAGNNNVLYATKNGKISPALSKFGTVSTPGALNGDYVYYVQDYNTHLDRNTKNKNYAKYALVDECYYSGTDVEKAASTKATPNYMWYLKDGQLKNMSVAPYVYEVEVTPNDGSDNWSYVDQRQEAVESSPVVDTDGNIRDYTLVAQPSYSGVITLIDEANGIYAFNTDTLKLTKGPKVEDVQKTAYKKVSKEDEVNGALSFRLKSVLGDDLYVVTKKDGKLYVANGDLDGAEKFKVSLLFEVKVGNGLIRPYYVLKNRTETKSLTTDWADSRTYYTWDESGTGISFYATGVENEYKILNHSEAITANAATGLLENTSRCSQENVLFEFAKKDAPRYGSPKFGHVQITTLEDDNKMIAPQLDGFAALKSEGQILKSDVYTNDSLKLWLDTAYIEDEGSKPFYYLSSTAFNEPGAKRNYLINPLNRENELDEPFYTFTAMSGTNRAAFTPASVCGKDSLAIFENDTIDVHELNPAAVLFQVVAEEGDEVYNIVSQLHYVNPDFDPEITDEDDPRHYPYYRWNAPYYLAQLNNVLFWTQDELKAEAFVINRTTAPTANEAVEAETVKVIGGQGVVTVQGAAGKVVTVSNILGQTIANFVATSDNVTIAAPAGVAVVAVDGDATKVVVK